MMENKKKYQKVYFMLFYAIFIMAFFISHNTLPPAYAADEKDDAEKQLEDSYDDLKKIEKKIKKTQDILELKQKEKEVINAQITNLANENSRVKKDIEKNEKEIKNLESDIDRTKREIQQKENHISLQKKMLEKFLREKYQSFSQNNKYFTALNIANSNHNNHNDRLAHATESVGDFVAKINSEQEKLEKDRKKLESKTEEIKDTQYELEQRSTHLKNSQNYKRVLAAEVTAEEGEYQNKLSKLVKEQLEIQQEISNLSTSQIGSFSMADLPDADDADFDMPMKKPYVRTQDYGKTTFSHNYSTGAHNGIDFVAKGSQSILAAADGKVEATGNMGNYGYGKWVAIDHKNGLVTLYGHLSSVSVSRGDKVDQGDKLGKMGNTGFSTGPHLHFTVFAETTFGIVESSKVKGVFIPSGATVNPDIYL